MKLDKALIVVQVALLAAILVNALLIIIEKRTSIVPLPYLVFANFGLLMWIAARAKTKKAKSESEKS